MHYQAHHHATAAAAARQQQRPCDVFQVYSPLARGPYAGGPVGPGAAGGGAAGPGGWAPPAGGDGGGGAPGGCHSLPVAILELTCRIDELRFTAAGDRAGGAAQAAGSHCCRVSS